MMKTKVWKIIKIIWFSIGVLFVIWNWTTFQSRNLPNETLSSTDVVEVQENNEMISFLPKKSKNTLELIFFQGGLVDPKAYAPLCKKIAESGFACHIIKMSFRLPKWDYKKISDLFDLKSRNYVIGGHSQGGKMAAQFVYENPKLMKGLCIMGTSHPRDINLSAQSIPSLKLYSENDGLASVDEVIENKNKLPINTKLIFIKGGNHSQFGYLGHLLGDNDATINLEEQQSIVLQNMVLFLEETQNGL